MAKDPKLVAYNVDLPVSPERAKILLATIETPGVTDVQKVAYLALNLLEQLADGGMMVSPQELKHIEDCVGISLSQAEELVPLLEEATGRSAGMYRYHFDIDPSYIGAYEEIASVRGGTVDEIVNEIIRRAQDEEWVERLWERQQPIPYLIKKEDARELEEILGSKFSNGTELVGLIRRQAGMNSLFADEKVTAIR